MRALSSSVALVVLVLAWAAPAAADVAYLYDDLGRLSRVIRGDGEAATYHYDAVGNILSITRESGVSQTTTVSSVSTFTAPQGGRVTVTIIGTNLNGAMVSTTAPGVTIANVRTTSDGITFDLIIDDEAPVGPVTIVITGGLGVVTVPLTITVAPPTITSFSPTSGAVGDPVTIQGRHFDDRGASFNAVTFNGAPAVVTTATRMSITTSVPRGATTGPIRVTTANGTGVSATPFTFSPAAPTITSFSPAFGAVGTTVAVQGQHFDERGASFNAVTFNGVTATVQTATSTSITTSVPTGATSGPIRVTTADGTAVSATPFGVLTGTLTPIGTITSPFVAPLDVVVSTDRSRAFVMDGGSVKVVDTATHTIVRTIPTANDAEHGVLSPNGTRLYVLGNSGSTGVIDVVNGTEVATIPAGGIDVPGQVALTPDGRTLYIANRFGNAVTVIDTVTNTVTGTLAINSPVAVTASPGGGRVYVVGTNTTSVVDTDTNTVVGTIPGGGSFGLFSPDGARFYHDGPGDDMTVIDTASNAAVSVISGVGEVLYLAINAAGTRLYAARLAPGAFETSLAVIDLATGTVAANVVVPPGIPDGMVLTPDGQRLVLVYDAFDEPQDAVTVVDTSTNTVVASIPLNGQEGLGSAAVGNRLVYVSMTDTGNVAVIDLAANVALDVPIARTGNPRPPIVFAPNGGPAYGAAGSTTIVSFDPSTLQARRNFSVTRDPDVFGSGGPAAVAVDPVSGGALYFANESFLHFVHVASGATIATLAIPNIASLYPSPDGSRLIALTFFGDVIVVDTASRTPIATLSLGVVSTVSVTNAGGTRLYLADSASIYVVDLVGPTRIATIPSPVGPDKLVLSGDGSKLVALARGDMRLVIVDTASNTLVGTLSLGGVLNDVVAGPTEARVYVADGTANTIRVVDASTASLVASLSVPASPTRVAVSPDGARLFVVEGPAGLVSVITVQSGDTSSLTLSPPLGEIAVAPNGRVFIQQLESPFESGFLVRRPLVVLE